MSIPEDIPSPPESFQSKEEAILWMLNTNSEKHKEARTKKSDKTRVYFQCTKPECEYTCHIRKNSDNLFRVVEWKWHTCGDFSQPKVKRAWITEKAKQLLGEREEAKPIELQENIKENLGVDVDIHATRRAVANARKIMDDEAASFDKLPGLFEALREQNPGTVTDIAMEEGRLKMAFLCPGPCARAWSHCPKMIALDGAHGTSVYKGVVLIATALDGAGQIFPIAIGFALSETNHSWRFFVRNLADALDIRETPLTVISDRCKGIDNGVSEFLPRAAHSYCAFHIRQNVSKFGKTAADFVWKIADASTEKEYNEAIAALGNISPEAQAYLRGIPKEQWVRAFFPLPRYGHITSNIAESTNSSFLKIRRCPPTKLFITAVQKINETFAQRREQYANGHETDIVTDVFAKIVKNTEDGRKLQARNVNQSVFDVQADVGIKKSRIVNLETMTCTCKLFQDMGYPCVHGCSAALKGGVNIPSLCINERRVGTLRRVYEAGIIPIDLDTIRTMVLLPPLVQRQVGRPKVKRIRRQIEDRPKSIHFCSLCRQSGHNAKTCPERRP